MEQNSTCHKQLRKKVTVRAVKNKKTRMLEGDMKKIDEKIDEIAREIIRIKTAIRRRRQED